MFLNKQIDKYNLDDFKGQGSSLLYYLDMTKDFKSSFKDMAIINVDGYNVIDESRSNPYGAKSRFGEYLVKQIYILMNGLSFKQIYSQIKIQNLQLK